MRFSRHAWWLYLAFVGTIAVGYLAGPLNAGPVFNVIGFSACVAIVVGVRVHRPAARWGSYLIALGQLLFVSGDVLAYNYKTFFGTALPFPSVADPFYLAVYPLTVAGLLVLIRHRNPGRDWGSLIDAAIVTIGVALLSWVFLIAPYANDQTLQIGTKLVSVAYPFGDILMLGVAVRMAVGAGRRSRAYYMMIAAIAGVLVTDTVYGWILLHGTYHPGDLLDGGWIVYYVLWGAAALHPSMTSISEAAAPSMKLTRARILAIAAAALIAPVIEMVSAPRRVATRSSWEALGSFCFRSSSCEWSAWPVTSRARPSGSAPCAGRSASWSPPPAGRRSCAPPKTPSQCSPAPRPNRPCSRSSSARARGGWWAQTLEVATSSSCRWRRSRRMSSINLPGACRLRYPTDATRSVRA